MMPSGLAREEKYRTEERRVGKEGRYWRDWSSDVCSSDLFTILDFDQQAAALAIGIQKFFQAHDAFRFGSRRKISGEIHGLHLGALEIVDMLAGQAYLAEKPVVPEHGDFIATELHVGFYAINGIFQSLVESRAGVFRRLLIGATGSKDHGFSHGSSSMNRFMETLSAAKFGLYIRRRRIPALRFF